VKSQILSVFPAELVETFSIHYDNYWHMPKVQSGEWDGKYRFIDVKSGKFPTGLLKQVVKWLEEHDFSVKVEDERIDPVESWWLSEFCLEGIKLRDYQLDAVKDALEEKRGVLQLPTGSGKTEIAIGIVKALGIRTLYLVNTKDLLHQTRDRFNKRVRMEVGIIGDGEFLPGHDVTIATVQSLDSWMKAKKDRFYPLPTVDGKISGLKYKEKDFSMDFKKFVNSHQCLILDECHHASATTWYKIAMYCHNAYYRYGLSGTPLDRHDLLNMKLVACIGDRIFYLPTKDLQETGDLCDIEIRIVENKECFGGGKWQTIHKNGIVESKQRNEAIQKIAKYHLDSNDRTLILVREIKHGRLLERSLMEIDVPVIFLQGLTKSKYREEVMKSFNQAGRFVLIATPIFDEGVDLPNVNVVVQAPGGKSDVKTIQRTGRGLRKKEDGGKLIVYDFADHSQYLLEHSIKRIETYQRVFGKESLRYDLGRLIEGSEEPLERLFEADV
jgi:superfamily II DNA or RNA helicase